MQRQLQPTPLRALRQAEIKAAQAVHVYIHEVLFLPM